MFKWETQVRAYRQAYPDLYVHDLLRFEVGNNLIGLPSGRIIMKTNPGTGPRLGACGELIFFSIVLSPPRPEQTLPLATRP